MNLKSIGNVFKVIDAYPKTLEDFTVKTTSGAVGIYAGSFDNFQLIIYDPHFFFVVN